VDERRNERNATGDREEMTGGRVINFPAVVCTRSTSIPESDAAMRRTAEGSGTENSVRVRPNSAVSIE